MGVAYSKTAAKTASEEKKPDGYFEIRTAEDFVNLIIDRDVRVLYTVGAMTAEKLHGAGIHTVRDIRERQEEVVRLLGKQGRWIARLAQGIDERRVEPYRPEEAKSIGRELTFQKDVDDFAFLQDVLVLLALSVENRARRVGLHGSGLTLKVTYADMKGVSRSSMNLFHDDAASIWQEAARLLGQIERRPIRLIGVSLGHLAPEEERQLSFADCFADETEAQQAALRRLLDTLQARYRLDFAGHLPEIMHTETLHKTVEYMRKHRP